MFIIKLLTAEVMREADRITIREKGFPGIALMENAGMRITEAVISLNPLPRNVLVLAGPGNNGGDGVVTARQLLCLGFDVSIWTLIAPLEYRGDAGINMGYLNNIGVKTTLIKDTGIMGQLNEELLSADLIIDALLGTGSGRHLEGLLAQVVDAVNESGTPVLSVDIPSGIDADTGQILGTAIKAWWTVTLAYPKRGLVLFPGADYAGRVTVAEIYVDGDTVSEEKIEMVTPFRVASNLPGRPRDAHKGTFGRVMVVAGSPGMTGAAVLASEAALRGGAGLVYLASASSLCPALEAKLVEVITMGMPEEKEGIISAKAAVDILNLVSGIKAIAVGPGLEPGNETLHLVESLVVNSPVPIVLDAGALGASAKEPDILLRAKAPLVITPHTGEMALLTGLSIREVEEQRLELPANVARTWNMVVVLKGAPTVTAFPDGTTYVNTTGGPTLSTAGTGDLLTGIIASFISQGLSPGEAALTAVYLHGLAGDMTAEEGRGIKAGDVLLRFPAAFDVLENRKWRPCPFGPFHRDMRVRNEV